MTKTNVPWYKKFSEYTQHCEELEINIGSALRENSEFAKELMSMVAFQKIATIYESNLIEDAGLPKEATRKIIEAIMPSFPHNAKAYSSGTTLEMIGSGGLDLTPEAMSSLAEEILKSISEPEKVISSVVQSLSFRGKNRKNLEVARHFMALEQAENHAISKHFSRYLSRYAELNISKADWNPAAIDMKLIDRMKSESETSLTEDDVKKFHFTMADGLLPKDAGVSAGEYRIDERGVGDYTVKFPSPSLVPKCMEQWIAETNRIIEDVRESKISVYDAAAIISYKFVWIHPFPDFNGRMSRLLMNWVILVSGKPIAVDLRGQSDDKHKYITSLKHANRGNFKSLAALIARRRSQILLNLWSNITATGYSANH